MYEYFLFQIMFVEDFYNKYFTRSINISANQSSVTTERAGVQYVLFNSFLDRQSYLTGFSLLASQSGTVQINVSNCFPNAFFFLRNQKKNFNFKILTFNFCNSTTSCYNYFVQNAKITNGVSKSVSMSFKLTQGLNSFNLSSKYYVDAYSCISWESGQLNGGLIAFDTSIAQYSDFILTVDSNGTYTFNEIQKNSSKPFAFSLNVESYFKVYTYTTNNRYLQTGYFNVSANVPNKPQQLLTTLTIYDSN